MVAKFGCGIQRNFMHCFLKDQAQMNVYKKKMWTKMMC